MTGQNIKKFYLNCQIPIEMLKQNSIPNSSLNKLKIYSSKGADELCMYHLANTPVLKLRIFSGSLQVFTSTVEYF